MRKILLILVFLTQILFSYDFTEFNIVFGKYLEGKIFESIEEMKRLQVSKEVEVIKNEFLSNSLMILAKDEIVNFNYQNALNYLNEIYKIKQDQNVRNLILLLEFEMKFPTQDSPSFTKDISVDEEKKNLFDLIFYPEKYLKPKEEFEVVIHIVKSGELLTTIAEKYYKNPNKWRKIWKDNPHIKNPHRLFPGEKLYIYLPK
jgi:nucleoid-associated protein YgaU